MDLAQDLELMTKLGHVIARAQRVYSVEGVVNAAGAALEEQSLRCFVLQLKADVLRLQYIRMEPAFEQELERLLRHPLQGFEAALLPELHPHWEDLNAAEALARFLSSPAPSLRKLVTLLESAGYGNGIVASLSVQGRPWGFVGVCSEQLTASSVPAVRLFGEQLSAALEAASCIESLETKNRALAAIHEVVTVAEQSELERILPRLLGILAQATESPHAAVFLLNEQRSELVMTATIGNTPELEARYKRLSFANNPSTWTVSHSLKPRAFSVFQLPDPAREDLHRLGISELAIIPMQIKGRLAGSVNLARRTPRPYTADDLETGDLLAEQIAIQIENARLYGEAHQRVAQLSLLFNLARIGTESTDVQTLVDEVLRESTAALSARFAVMYLMVDEGLVLSGFQSSKPGEPFSQSFASEYSVLATDGRNLARECVARKTTLVVSVEPSETHPQGSPLRMAAAPLLAKKEILGAVVLARSAEVPFSTDELRLLESSAALLGVAVDRARLFEAEHRRAQDFAAINALGAQIAERLDLLSVLSTGVHQLARLCDVPNVLLFLLDRDSQRLRLAKSNRPSESSPELLSLSEPSSATSAIRSMSPVVIADAIHDPRANKSFTDQMGHRSALSVPLIAGGQPIGAVILGETRAKRSFTENEVERAMAICNQLAAAISAARLYDDLKRSYEELSRTQEELVKRERLAAVGELAALVAHEIRNPLAVIFNSLSSLKKRVGSEEQVQVLLRILSEEANRLNSIVGDFLDFARPHEPDLQVGSLNEIIEEAVHASRRMVTGVAIDIQMRLDQDLPQFVFDSRLLRQALVNLVVNALQSMPKGGTLTLRSVCTTHSDKPWVQVEISDTGAGVPAHLRGKLFQPFFTTKAMGTGLGLAVVKRIVDAHQGEIAFESEVGRGTRFFLRLPRKGQR